jgi:uncharacterized protein YcgI (DUF1989 family)
MRVNAAKAWVRWMKGGLAHGTVIGCTGFAARSGSSVASTLTIGRAGMPYRQDNLARAIRTFGHGPQDVHDPFNIFTTTEMNADGRPFYLPCDARKSDYVELIAEIDCLVAISACPGGSSGSESRPLAVETFDAPR